MIEIGNHGEIRELRLARPPVNALHPPLLAQLRDAVRAAPGDGVQGLVIAGGPNAFSAGLDVPHLMGLGRDALSDAWRVFFETAQAIAESPIPVVAAIAGHSPAGGCVLALCCDYRVMARGPFRIGLNEVQVGLAVPEGIQHLMRRVVGAYRAERLMVEGAMVEAEQALAIGLVDELTDVDHVATRARAWLEELLAKPRRPMLETRRIARADLVGALTDPARLDLVRFIEHWHRDDTQAVLNGLVARLGARKSG